jgi:hypothetical protein
MEYHWTTKIRLYILPFQNVSTANMANINASLPDIGEIVIHVSVIYPARYEVIENLHETGCMTLLNAATQKRLG